MRRRLSLLIGAAVTASAGLWFASALAAAPTITEYPVQAGAQVESITTGSDGNLWFVEYNNGFIGKITPSGTVTEFAVPSGSSSGPRVITAGPDGNLWFTENGLNKIGKITTAGSFTEYTIPTSSSAPLGITAGPDGNLWFAEQTGNKIGKITTSGTFTEYADTVASDQPTNITAGPDGNLWFTQYGDNKIGKITTGGTITQVQVASTTQPGLSGITSGPDGNLWFTEFIDNKIVKMTTGGVTTEYSAPSPSAGPGDIAAGPDGDLWFTEGSVAKIGRITTAGTTFEYAPPTNTGLFGITAGPDGNVWFGEIAAKVGKIVLSAATKPGITNQKVAAVTGQSKVVNVVSGVSGSPAASTLKIVRGPSHGTATANTTNGTITYTSTAGYIGSDAVTYELCSTSDNGVCSSAVLTLTVAASAPNTGFGIITSNPLVPLAIGAAIAALLAIASVIIRKRNIYSQRR